MSLQITVKSNLIIFHRPEQWRIIRDQLIEEYGLSIVIRSRMRRELGFTVREHAQWIDRPVSTSDFDIIGYYQDQVHLDFYNSAAQSWFQLKYL